MDSANWRTASESRYASSVSRETGGKSSIRPTKLRNLSGKPCETSIARSQYAEIWEKYSAFVISPDQLSGIRLSHSGRREPIDDWCGLGRRPTSSFQPTSGTSLNKVEIATRRVSIEAQVCGNQGKKIVSRELIGLFDQFPPGSRFASSPKSTVVRVRYSSLHASVSNPHKRPLM